VRRHLPHPQHPRRFCVVKSFAHRYDVQFNVTGVPNDNYIPLDASTGIIDIDCDYDQTSLNLKFDSNDHVLSFMARIVAGGSFKIFVTSSFNFSSCKDIDLKLVRRVVSATPDASNRVNVLLKAIVAHYDELIQDGTISLTPSGAPAPLQPNRFCVVNPRGRSLLPSPPRPEVLRWPQRERRVRGREAAYHHIRQQVHFHDVCRLLHGVCGGCVSGGQVEQLEGVGCGGGGGGDVHDDDNNPTAASSSPCSPPPPSRPGRVSSGWLPEHVGAVLRSH
jgi:hypothetical protein